jgi:DNA-binding transcriptional ArsR family regulator
MADIMHEDDLHGEIADLRERLTRLEERLTPVGMTPEKQRNPLAKEVDEHFAALDAAARTRPIGKIKAWFYFRSEHSQFLGDEEEELAALLALPSDALAGSLAGLAHPARIEIFKALLDGKKDSNSLLKAAGLNTTGQLYHHLREMEEVGLVVRHGRNLWALENLHAFALAMVVGKALMDWRGEGKAGRR